MTLPLSPKKPRSSRSALLLRLPANFQETPKTKNIFSSVSMPTDAVIHRRHLHTNDTNDIIEGCDNAMSLTDTLNHDIGYLLKCQSEIFVYNDTCKKFTNDAVKTKDFDQQ
jgi:hypothetical protein